MKKETDYEPGDFPVPVGTTVYYFGSHPHGFYEVTARLRPEAHPTRSPEEIREADAYPDNAAYILWPSGMAHKFGNRDHAVYWARRRSFRVVTEDSDD